MELFTNEIKQCMQLVSMLKDKNIISVVKNTKDVEIVYHLTDIKFTPNGVLTSITKIPHNSDCIMNLSILLDLNRFVNFFDDDVSFVTQYGEIVDAKNIINSCIEIRLMLNMIRKNNNPD